MNPVKPLGGNALCWAQLCHFTLSFLGVHRISNPVGIPAGFDEFSKSGIRPDFLLNPAGFTGF